MTEPFRRVAPLTELEFSSTVPVVGPLVSVMRRAWHNVAGRWALRWFAQQQDAINSAASADLGRHEAALRELRAEHDGRDEKLRAYAMQLSEHAAALARVAVSTGRIEKLEASGEALTERIAGAISQIQTLEASGVTQADRITSLAGRLDEMGSALAATRAQASDMAAELAGQQSALTSQAADFARRVEGVATASEAYLKELGHELGELARRVAELGENATANRPGPG